MQYPVPCDIQRFRIFKYPPITKYRFRQFNVVTGYFGLASVQTGKYLIYNNSKPYMDKEDLLHGYCHQFVLDNYRKGDTVCLITDYDYDIESVCL